MDRVPKKTGLLRFEAELLFGHRPDTPEAAVNFCARSPLQFRQVRAEILEWTKVLADYAPRRCLEITSSRGGNLFLLCNFSASDALIMSLEMPKRPHGTAYEWLSDLRFKPFARSDQNLLLLRGNPGSPESLVRILRLLNGALLDVLFLDGDHSYEGVKRDFEMYSQLVRPGGLIAIQDIAPHPSEKLGEVSKFWNEIKQRHPHRELLEDARQGWAGIGILNMLRLK